MPFRRSAAYALAAVALVSGCKKVEQETSPAEIVVAAFNSAACSDPSALDPLRCSATAIPTPNDLVLQAVPTLPASAQRALLQSFVDAGGFPSDQAVGITIPIKRVVFNAATTRYDLATYAQSPLVDPATLTTTGAGRTVVVLRIDGATPVEQTVEVDAANCTTGQIALMKAKNAAGSRAWAPGRYVFAMRAGAVKTRTGVPIDADQAIALVAPNKDLTNPDNQPPGGLPPALAAQVDSVRRALWNAVDWGNPGNGTWTVTGAGTNAAFSAVAPFIPADQVAVIATFEVAPAVATAPVDSGSGIAPLPLDLLRTTPPPGGTGPLMITKNPAFGAASDMVASLDGFSTTAMILAQTNTPIRASTVNGNTVYLFKLPAAGAPVLLPEWKSEILAGRSGSAAAYVAEPPPISAACGLPAAPPFYPAGDQCAQVVGLQPATGVGAPGAPGTVYLPTLEEGTDYAVVITTAVRDVAGNRLAKSTVGKILTDPSPAFNVLVHPVSGKSLLAGISDDTAAALQRMRAQLLPVLAALPGGQTGADVALAYTFRTQGKIVSTALNLVGLPYAPVIGSGAVLDATFFTTTEIAATYGMDESFLVSPAGLTSVAEVKLTTTSLLLGSQNTGAFVDPATDPGHVTTEVITAIVALPDPANVPSTCAHVAAIGYPGGLQCAPLVVFSHGLARTKADVLPVAAALTSRGFIVAAIDAEKHGERSYCQGTTQAAADLQCCPAPLLGGAAGLLCGNSTCEFKANLTTPADGALRFGFCKDGVGERRYFSYRADFRTRAGCDQPILPSGAPNPAYPQGCLSPKGNAFVSGQQFVSLNFIRVRDTMRQNAIDKSALVKALGLIPFAANAFSSTLAARGLAVDPLRTYYVGHSFGAITDAVTLAANPRINRGVLAAPGATAVDTFSNPESHYSANLIALLATANPPILPGTSDFLRTLQVAKWILDPAEPANFVSFVLPGALPNPFQGTALAAFFPAQPTRDVMSQLSYKDGSVPNAQNAFYAGRLGYTVPAVGSAATDSFVQWYFDPVGPGTVSHENLLDFKDPSLTGQAQSNAAQFLVNPVGQAATVTP